MVERHWNLARDPFAPADPPFVATPPHAEAVARLVHLVESGERRARLRASAGLGKSIVLARALAGVRGPTRRLASIAAPADGPTLLAGLAQALGARVPADAPRAVAWRALADAARLCRLQGLGLVLAIDAADALAAPADRLDLERLVHLDPHPAARLTVLWTERDDREAGADSAWDLVVRLPPLTRGEAEGYLAAKLAAAGRCEPTFTPRAITRLHALAGGVPRGLDRLASLGLLAAAARGLEMVPPEVIDGVAAECVGVAGAMPTPVF